MTFATGAKKRALDDKQEIDKLIDMLNSGRLSYILKSADPFQKAMHFLRESNNEELHNIVLRHRFYFELKTKEVIDDVGQ
jgi:hypothetical protein